MFYLNNHHKRITRDALISHNKTQGIDIYEKKILMLRNNPKFLFVDAQRPSLTRVVKFIGESNDT